MISRLINTVSRRLTGGSETHLFGIRSNLLERFSRILKRDRKAQVGLSIVAVVSLIAIFAPVIAPYDPMSQNFPVMQPPTFTGAHPLGTDSFGRDLLSRVVFGARLSLAVGLSAVAFGTLIGVPMGLYAGYYGGWVDDLLMRMVDTMWAFPALLIAILAVAIHGQSIWVPIFAIGFALIDDFARITRGEVLSIREEEYTLAAESIGMGKFKIMFEEILPNAVAPILVQYTVSTARAILTEATLSFLGIGVKITTPTWGSLLRQGRGFIQQAWWISIIPGLIIMITVLGINLFGDALRDAFDVKESGGT
ncbi:ABC transporter permease [Haloplanus sp. GCM10025708]|uniref:ABC transporter permease n=1 Tax=Haloferacaceae TaxID=1644056 RepID=UPI00360AC917